MFHITRFTDSWDMMLGDAKVTQYQFDVFANGLASDNSRLSRLDLRCA